MHASKWGVIAVISLMCAMDLRAEDLDQRLSEASRAYRQGNYQLAQDKLLQVKSSVDKLPLNEQIVYWDLLSNLENASGRFLHAENAALRHLALVRLASTTAGGGDFLGEPQSLLQLAKVKRELSQFSEACRLYREALQISRSGEANAPLWEAEARFELATTLELLHQSDASAREFDAANASTEAALKKLLSGKALTDDFLRATTLLRRAFSSRDETGPKRQADKALVYINNALQSNEVSPQLRSKLQISVSACYQQLGNNQKIGRDEQIAFRSAERRVLERVLGETQDQRPQLEPVARAEAMIRLAELADSTESVSHKPGERESTKYYQQASKLYEQIQAAAKERPTATKNDNHQRQAASNESPLDRSFGDEAECLLRLQLIYTRLGDWDAAIKKVEDLSSLRTRSLTADDPNYFRTLSALGSLYAMKARTTQTNTDAVVRSNSSGQNDIDRAQKYLAKASEFWSTREPLSATDLSSTLSYFAEVCRYAGDFKRADELLNQAAPHFQSLDKQDAASERQLAEFYLNRGAVQAAIGHFERAKRNYKSAEVIAQRTDGADIRERRFLLALIYINQAQLEKSQRHLPQARQDCEKALKAAEDAGFTDDDLIPFQLANASLLIVEAENSESQATLAQLSNGSNTGITHIDASANLSRAVTLTATVLRRNAPEPYFTTGRHLQALARFRMFERDNDPTKLRAAEDMWNQIVASPADTVPQFKALKMRALIYLVQIALRDVRDKREEANQLSKSDAADGTQIDDLTNQSNARLAAAKELSRKAEELAQTTIGYPAVRVQALLVRAHLLRAEAQISQAKMLRQPAPQAAENQQLVNRARSDAIQALKKAISIVESPRAMTVGAEEERAAYFAQFGPVFDLLIDLLVEEKRYVEALETAELRRSRTYQDQLQTSGVNLYAADDPKKVEEFKLAKKRFFEAVAQFNDKSDKESKITISQDLPKLEDALIKAEKEARGTKFRRQLIREKDPNDQPVVDPCAWVHQQIGDDDVALLYYIGAEKSYVFACGRQIGVTADLLTVSPEQAKKRALPMPAATGGTNVERRPLRADDVIQIVRDVRAEIEQSMKAQGRRGGNAAKTELEGLQRVRSGKVDANSDSFVTDIFLPVALREKIVKCGARHLIVVPDGALHQLPLELLPCDPSRNRYLLDILPPMCYAPSLHIYRTLQQQPTKRVSRLTLISLAIPRYAAANDPHDPSANDGLSSTGREYMNRARGLAPLSGTADESTEVRGAFGTLNTERIRVIPLLDDHASEAKLKENLKDPSVAFLHVAAHGLTSQKYNNLFGALALATPARPTAEDDGFLSLYEVYELKLPSCELAVLSACETNCGTDSPLEAGSTMARAFICAGSRRVVCSHWDISDQATAPLVGRFMQRVARDFRDEQVVDYARALHAAKKSLRDDSQTVAPWLWAPFILIGPPTGSNVGGHRVAITAQNN